MRVLPGPPSDETSGSDALHRREFSARFSTDFIPGQSLSGIIRRSYSFLIHVILLIKSRRTSGCSTASKEESLVRVSMSLIHSLTTFEHFWKRFLLKTCHAFFTAELSDGHGLFDMTGRDRESKR
jgi:hypothetical protein